MASSSTDPGTAFYSSKQIALYLKHISFPEDKIPGLTSITTSDVRLAHLKLLQAYHLAAIPFENLSLHYSEHRTVSLDKDDIFQKIVGNGQGRGGYCVEQNLFFGTIMKSLGYDVIPIGGRVYLEIGELGGLSHQVNLVFIDGKPYVVDVGFGANGPTHPMPLEHNYISPWGNTASSVRLTHIPAPHPLLPGTWTYSHRISDGHDWVPMYDFVTVELLKQDFQIMNYWVYSRPQSWFTQKIACVKMIMDAETEQISGVLILVGAGLKQRVQEKEEVLVDCKSEADRTEALEKYFDIVLSERQRNGIRGLVTELR